MKRSSVHPPWLACNYIVTPVWYWWFYDALLLLFFKKIPFSYLLLTLIDTRWYILFYLMIFLSTAGYNESEGLCQASSSQANPDAFKEMPLLPHRTLTAESRHHLLFTRFLLKQQNICQFSKAACLKTADVVCKCICINSFLLKGWAQKQHECCNSLSWESLIAVYYILQAKRELHLTL